MCVILTELVGFVGGITFSAGGVFASYLSGSVDCSCGGLSVLVLMTNSCGALGNGGKVHQAVMPLKDRETTVAS